MANRIAEAFIELKAKGAGKVRGVMKSLRGDLKSVDKEADNVAGSFNRGLGAAEKFQSVLGKLLIPVALVTSVAGIVRSFRQGITEARKFREEIEQISAEAAKISKEFEQQSRSLSPAVAQATELQNAYGALIDDAEARLRSIEGPSNFLEESLENVRALLTDEPVTIARKQAVIQSEINEIYNQQRTAVSRLAAINAANAQRSAERAEQENRNLEIARLQSQLATAKTADERRALGVQIETLEIAKQTAEVNRQIRDQSTFNIDGDPFLAVLKKRKALLEQIFRERVGAINKEADAQIEADKKAEEEKRKQARETARIIADANAQAAAETRQALLDAVSSINSDRGAFSQLEGLISSIGDDVKLLRGRL